MRRKSIRKIAFVSAIILATSLIGCGKANTVEIEDTAVDSLAAVSDEQEVEANNLEADEQTAESNAESDEETEEEAVEELLYDINLVFAGDLNLAEDYGTTDLLDSVDGDVSQCIDPKLIDVMTSADLMVLNNEFAYSDRGAPLEGKAYTFRANPDRAKVLTDLGVDAVYLANNHIYDYGKDACLDTFETLKQNDIAYFGAGKDIDEASAPYYIEIQGKKIALVAASRAEKNKMTPQATETEPGILRCYDTELFCDTIEEAAKNADYTIAIVHWGTEYSTELEQVQLNTAKEYVKAGADLIIGAHPHCLQGIEYVYGVPVLYSLGNYWFNEKTLDTMLACVRLYGDSNGNYVELSLVPGVQENWHTRLAEGEEAARIFEDIQNISIDVSIDEEGKVHSAGLVPLIENLCEVRFEVDYPVGQITKDVTVTQNFINKTNSIVTLDLLGATYKRDNTATVDIELLVEDESLAHWSVASEEFEDNVVMEFVLGDESAASDFSLDSDEKNLFYADMVNGELNSNLVGKECKIIISSKDGEPDLSPTFWMTEDNNYPDGCLNIAGYDQYNDLWFQVYGCD